VKTMNTLILIIASLMSLSYITFAVITYSTEILNGSKFFTILN